MLIKKFKFNELKDGTYFIIYMDAGNKYRRIPVYRKMSGDTMVRMKEDSHGALYCDFGTITAPNSLDMMVCVLGFNDD